MQRCLYPFAYVYHKEKQPRKGSPARRGFYDYLVHMIEARTQEGHRYSSLFAPACVGHKCHRAVESILEDAVRLAAKLGLPKHEAEHAVAACNPEKAQTVRAATLEGWLGWSFDRKTKRNGRTRAEHLAEIAERRTAASRSRVTDYLERHPKATISEIARTLAWAVRPSPSTSTSGSRPCATKSSSRQRPCLMRAHPPTAPTLKQPIRQHRSQLPNRPTAPAVVPSSPFTPSCVIHCVITYP